GLGRELEIGSLDDGIDRARLLAVAAVNALGHVDVVARGAAATVIARLGLDGDGLRRADRLAELAGNAALLAVGIPAQRMLTAEARAERPLLEGIVHRHLGLEHVLKRERETGDDLRQKKGACGAIERSHGVLSLLAENRAAELDEGGRDDDPAERQRQEHLPTQAHQLVVAVTRQRSLGPREDEEKHRDLQRKPQHAPWTP